MKTQDTKRNGRRRQLQRITVKDVAEAAGVSMMSVSNVIHNRAHVSDALRHLVQEKIKELGYVPNRAAQELAGVVRPHFALLYPGVINPFIAAIIVGAMKAAERLKVDVSVQLAQIDDQKALRETMQRLEREGIEGFLLPSPIAEFVASAYHQKPLSVPAVALAPGTPLPGMASVRCDERQAAIGLVSILIEAGHRHIGHLAGPVTQSGSVARRQGYEIALRAQGIEPKPEDIVVSPAYTFQEGVKAAEALLNGNPKLTAVFAANDTLAAAVLAVAHRRNIPVPTAFSVVGYDDAPVAEQVWPGLSTVHQDAPNMTERAVELLVEGVRAWKADRSFKLVGDVVLPYRIIERGSVGRINAGEDLS